MISPLLRTIKLSFFLLIFMLATGCAADSQTITIFAASSLTDAFSELATAYEAENPEIDVLLNFAGSSQLAAQLQEGIVGDIFASANPAQMAAVIKTGRISADSVQTFATNWLTLIVPSDNPANLTTFEELAKPNVQLILAARGVPVRVYTDEMVARVSSETFSPNFYNNLVSEEDNVRVVVAKIALGEADAGIVYVSDVTADIASRVQAIAIPAEQNVLATYPIAPLTDANNPALAQQFIDFVLSEKGQAILARWGLAQ